MATSEQTRRPLEPIFIATPPPTPRLHQHNSITRTTTPREMPTMYHFDFATSATTDPEAEDSMRGAEDEPLPPPPLTSNSSLPVPEYVAQEPSQLTPCPCCSRTFVVDALRKHVVICEKSSKKRKIFDSSRQRRDGTALSTYVLPKNFGLPNAERTAGLPSPPTTSRDPMTTSVNAATAEPVNSPLPVRRKSQAEMVRSTARASMRKAASTLSSNSATEAPAGTPTGPPAASAAPLVRERSMAKRIKAPACDRCPHCDRTFNPKAFDRHVEWCKEKAIQANMKSNNSLETNKAKERLEARKQYRPPNLKTKRSLARDKYSGNHEELLEAGEITTPKPNMMSLSMTSSVHSDNAQAQVSRPRTSAGAVARTKQNSSVTQNRVSLYNEDPPSSPPPREREALRRSKRKQLESCNEIDDTMERLRHNGSGDSLQLAKLDCVEAPVLQPARRRKGVSKMDKFDAVDKDISLPNLPQVTMTFDQLNGLIKRKGGTPICKVEMDEQEIANMTSKPHSSTSLVRQARRRIRTKENPNLELRSLQHGSVVSNDVQFASLDSSLVPLQRKQGKVYSGSEEDSPRAEIQLKLEATAMRTVCRPTKRSGQVTSNSEPMRARPMSGLKNSLEAINQSIGESVLPRLKLGNERMDFEPDEDEPDNYTSDLDDEAIEADLMIQGTKLLDRARSSPTPKGSLQMEDARSDEDEEEEEEKPALKLPPISKQNSNVSRRLVLLEEDEDGTMYIKSPPGAKRRTNSGLGDKYDPFLSAKRQLEELCSPSTPPPEEVVTTSTTKATRTLTPLATTTPTITPSIAMTTSLTTSISKPAQIAQKVAPTSNFRRTSSLRGPRRTPMLNSRPLFATNYRPTIQRGLSDEGPISTNFLKPEEFDEMPVRAACGNDFHSPRVVRRDTSASNRKQLLKLPMGGTNEVSNTPSSPQAGRNVAKTDSLAVFLKYEHELEQLNAKAAEMAAASQLTSKEQKDKSNTLSKQNSAKSLGQSTPSQLPPLTPTAVPTSPNVVKEVSYPPVATPLRLEPISKPVINPTAPLTPIKLESIFGPRRETSLGSGSGSVAGDFIDPKLINACDNLHMNSGISSDASSTPQQLSQSRSRSSSQSTITHERRQSGEARNLLKRKMRLGRNHFLYDASPEDADASSNCSADDEANRSSMEYDEQCWQQQQKQLLTNPLPLVMPMVHNAMPTFDDFDFEEFLSSFENENEDEQFPLFKDCREFLMNRSTSRQRSFQKATSTPQTTATQLTPHSHQSKIKDNHAHRSDQKMHDERLLQRQQSNASTASSHEEKQSRVEMEKRAAAENQPKREIFISIETEANAQGRSPISPESLRQMVGNAQTPIDVLHIENGNEPEHARFSKISDTEDAGDEHGDRASQATNRLAPSSSGSLLAPNVQLNNAKNLIQQMQSDFRQLGEEASASMRRMLIVNNGGRDDEQQRTSRELRDSNSGIQGQQHQQHQVKTNHPLTPSPSADSDELSSLDGYPMSSSQGSRRGASSKLSSDSAYGSSNSPYSFSRQRSTEVQTETPRPQGLLRPHTAGAKLPSCMLDASTQAQTDYGTLKARQRLFAPGNANNNGDGDEAEPSSSGSDNSFALQPKQHPQQTTNYNYQKQQQQQQHQQQTLSQSQSQTDYNTNNNNNVPMTPTTSEHSLMSSSSKSSSTKPSNYCYECGSKFIIETAKFCMDCGLRRVEL